MFERITSPAATDPYYINTDYGGYNRYTLIINKTTGAVIPNCTAFCFGSFMKCCGITACNLPVANAAEWYSRAPYPKGDTPKLGAIACWKGGTNSQGHVAFVNVINNDGSIVVAESGYYSQVWFMETTLKAPYSRSGLTFQGFIYNPFTEAKPVHITEGEQHYTHMGKEIIVLGQRAAWEVGMISAKGKDPHTALQDIKMLDDENAVVFGMINANYFQAQENQPDPYGEHYGVEISFTNEFVPHKGNVLGYALLIGGGSACLPDNRFWYSREEVKCAFAPAYVPYLGGSRVDLWSDAFKASKARETQQTMFIRTKERCALAVCTGNLTVTQLADWAGNSIDGLLDLCFMDSGGSSQMRIGYNTPVYTGRKIPNGICFYTPKQTDTGGEDEPAPIDPTVELKAEIEALKAENAMLADRLERIAAIAKEGAKT